MTGVYLGVAVFLLFTLAGGLARVLLGPTPADRMLAAQLLGTTGVAILLLLAETNGAALRDAALLLAALASLAVFAFVYRDVRHSSGREDER